MGESRLPFAFTWSPAVFTIISKRELHGNVILRFFRPAEFLLLYRHEHFIRNNGLMGVGVKESIHETIIFDLDSTSADRFLKQYPLVGEGIPCFSKPAAIFPRLSPAIYRANIQHTIFASLGFTVNSPLEPTSYP